MPQSTTAAYPKSENSQIENHVNSVCTLCDGSGFRLVRVGKRIDAYRCQCRLPQQKVAPKSWKMAAAGDVA
jgi:hypothetical protein